MFSDNGMDLVITNIDRRELHDFINKNAKILKNKVENEIVTWKFIPSSSPHMG